MKLCTYLDLLVMLRRNASNVCNCVLGMGRFGMEQLWSGINGGGLVTKQALDAASSSDN